MSKFNKIWPYLSLFLFILVVIQFIVRASEKAINYRDFEIKGSISPCSEDCSPFSVRTVYKGSQIEVHSSKTDYGGIFVAQICEDIIVGVKCTDLDITKLPDYKTVGRPNTSETFAIYTYINRYIDSPANKKIYFLYRTLQIDPDKSKWVYDDPLAIVSFDRETREVKKEGQLNVTGLNVKEMHVSPDGSYLLIVDADNPRYLPTTTRSNIILFDLKHKLTSTFASVGNGGTLSFISWINDKHFFYKEYNYGDGRNVTFRIGTLN